MILDGMTKERHTDDYLAALVPKSIQLAVLNIKDASMDDRNSCCPVSRTTFMRWCLAELCSSCRNVRQL
jgi:hypothetical protein